MKNVKTTKTAVKKIKPVNKKSKDNDLGFFESVNKYFNKDQSKVINKMIRFLDDLFGKKGFLSGSLNEIHNKIDYLAQFIDHSVRCNQSKNVKKADKKKSKTVVKKKGGKK